MVQQSEVNMQKLAEITEKVQSLTVFTSFANLSGSVWRTVGPWRWWSKAALKASGVWSSFRASKTCAMVANHMSMSSWLWPLIRQFNCADCSRALPTHSARKRKIVPFLHSRLVLSHCILRCTLRRSVYSPITLSVQANRSQHQLLSFATKWSERTKAAIWPWAMMPWASNDGRFSVENSFEVMFNDLGNLYLPLSMPSRMTVTTWQPELNEEPSRDCVRVCQYVTRSAYCFFRCLPYSAVCAWCANRLSFTCFNINLCLVHVWQEACWVFGRMAILWPKSRDHT